MKKIIALVFIMPISFGLNAQCAMCKAVAESNMNGGDSMASGLNNGIVFLMGIPYLLIGVIAYLLYRHRKSQKQAKTA